MIVDVVIAVAAGFATKNAWVFLALVALAAISIRIQPDLSLSSGLLKPGLMAIGISAVVLARVAGVVLTLALWAIGIAVLSS
ncbi:MAG: hypothetical protein IPN75_12685 [Dechloromonas sp.]|uniref:Uncharacterized protein n=1 Tax=Candidatus Dechloromonas phosphorivorans TaxID=2899244 RepID=A0A9D7QJD0_9RHOO|nr:hypothetical protein [Candidatus Dechloromonas phosphorivorans]